MRVNFMARVFILGAGASRFAGYPLSLELWKVVRAFLVIEVMAKRRADSVIQAMEQVLRVIPPRVFDQPNLEELFTFLDLAAMGAEPLGLKTVNWTELRPKVMGMISEAFLSHEYDFQTQLWRDKTSPAAAVLRSWTSSLPSRATILTFNGDRMDAMPLWNA